MGTIRVLPSAQATVEVTLRYLLEQRDRFRGVVIVTLGENGGSQLWLSNGITSAEQAFAGARITADCIEQAIEVEAEREPTG